MKLLVSTAIAMVLWVVAHANILGLIGTLATGLISIAMLFCIIDASNIGKRRVLK